MENARGCAREGGSFVATFVSITVYIYIYVNIHVYVFFVTVHGLGLGGYLHGHRAHPAQPGSAAARVAAQPVSAQPAALVVAAAERKLPPPLDLKQLLKLQSWPQAYPRKTNCYPVMKHTARRFVAPSSVLAPSSKARSP